MEVERTEIGGVPVFWADSQLPFVGSIVVRMGHVDESLLTHGMSHLLEHLVLATDWPVDDFNAIVMPLITHFWFTGEPQVATSRLTTTLASMREPPLARLGRERNILRTEAYGRGRSQQAVHAGLRFGPRGIGLTDYPEHGLQRATRTDAVAWAERFFVSGNVAITLSQPPPGDPAMALPDGPAVVPPTPRPLPSISYPASYVHGPDGSAGVSMLVERTHEIVVAVEIATHRLRQWLRHEEGVTYHVGSAYDPITKGDAHLVVWGDCRPDSAHTVRNALVAVLDDLASEGPTEDELERSRESFRRGRREPASVYDQLLYAAAQHILGDDVETPEQSIAAREAITALDIAAAVAKGFETVLVAAPAGTTHLGGRFEPYPIDAKPIQGVRYRPSAKDGKQALVVGDDGVSLEGESRRTVLFDDVVTYLVWDDGSVGLYGDDGDYVLVDPADWKHGERAAAAARRRLDPALVVDLSSDPPAFEDADLHAATDAFHAEDWTTAVERFEAGLKREPESADAWAMLAWAAHSAKAPHRAVEAAREAVRLDQYDVWSARFLSTRLLEAGHGFEAAAAAREALRRGAVDLDTLASAADVLSKAGHYDDALRVGRRAAELFPDSASAWFAYGWAARFASDWDRAEPALRRAVELAPDIGMWHNNLGVLLLDLGRPREALAAFDRAVELDADNDYSPANRALALHQLGRTKAATEALAVRRKQRIAEAERDLELAPEDPLALEKLARTLLAAERDEEAAALVREALAIEPSPTRHILLASALEWLERWDEARPVLDAALALDPDHVAALDELAWLAAVTDDVTTASDAAARIENLEDERRALYARGYAAVAERRGADAEAIFDELFARRPAGCCALAWRGIARLTQGRGDAAREDAERVRALVPTRCASLRHLERLLAL